MDVVVDLDQLDNGKYMISAGYDHSLIALRSEQDEVEEKTQKVHHNAVDDLGLPIDKALKLDKSTQFGQEEPKVWKKLNT